MGCPHTLKVNRPAVYSSGVGIIKIRSEVSLNSSADLERPHLWQGKGLQRVSLNKQPGTGAAIQRCFARKAHWKHVLSASLDQGFQMLHILIYMVVYVCISSIPLRMGWWSWLTGSSTNQRSHQPAEKRRETSQASDSTDQVLHPRQTARAEGRMTFCSRGQFTLVVWCPPHTVAACYGSQSQYRKIW